jgi:small-conductance mechanosensitive channel
METQPTIVDFFNPSGIPYGFVILVVTILLATTLRRVLDSAGDRFSNRRLLIQQVASFARFSIFLIGIVGTALTMLKLTQEVLLAVGGTLAVAVGFALKDLTASIVAGLIILLDQPFQVGDRVRFEDYYGEIKHIGLRSVQLVTLDDTLVTIPNNKFLTDVVASGNAGATEMMIQVDFHIGVDQDIERAKTIVAEALTASRYVHLKKPWEVLVSQEIVESYFAVRLRAKGYVLDVRFEKSFETDLTERVLEGFRGAHIGPPAVLHRSITPPQTHSD